MSNELPNSIFLSKGLPVRYKNPILHRFNFLEARPSIEG